MTLHHTFMATRGVHGQDWTVWLHRVGGHDVADCLTVSGIIFSLSCLSPYGCHLCISVCSIVEVPDAVIFLYFRGVHFLTMNGSPTIVSTT